jgi:hypothetical protein
MTSDRNKRLALLCRILLACCCVSGFLAQANTLSSSRRNREARVTIGALTLLPPPPDSVPLPGDATLNLVVLMRGNEAALKADAERRGHGGVDATNGLPMTVEEMRGRFGPKVSDLESVKAWLISRGFSIARVSEDNLHVFFDTTAAKAEQELGADMRTGTVRHQTRIINVHTLSVPAHIAPLIRGILIFNTVYDDPIGIKRP